MLADLVKVAVSGTPGTGTITLGAADTGCRTFLASFPAGAVVSYAIVDGGNRETGTGTYDAGANTLTRGLIASSTGALLNLTSGAYVFIDALADDINLDAAAAIAAMDAEL